jgi:hypothetical protein
VTVAIGEAGARALQALHQSRHVVDGWQLEEQMHVIGHDADLDDARVVSFGFREEKAREKIRHRRIDEADARRWSR